jgi:DNA-binding LacI/PurR family transcriptional regulator
MGYEPNLIARGLVKHRTQVVALITPDLHPHTHPIVRSVAEQCTLRKYMVMLAPANTWQSETLSFHYVAENWLLDGVIVYNLIYHPQVPDDIIELQSGRLPFVFVNKFLFEKQINAVGVDVEQSVLLALQHLAQLGHREIGILNGHRGSEDGASRYDAFRKGMDRLGLFLDPAWVREAVWEDQCAYREMNAILNMKRQPTAVFCANDHMAIGAIRAIRERGLRVPEDVSIVGYDDLEAGRYFSVPITTIRPPLHQVGKQSVNLLMENIRDPERQPKQIRFPSELLVRASTGPVREPC